MGAVCLVHDRKRRHVYAGLGMSLRAQDLIEVWFKRLFAEGPGNNDVAFGIGVLFAKQEHVMKIFGDSWKSPASLERRPILLFRREA